MDSASICGHQMDVEYGFYLPEYDNASPKMQSNFVSIQGMNGSLDLSEQDGIVYYNDVTKKLKFEKVTRNTSIADVQSISRQLNNDLVGFQGNLIYDDDPDFYYYGRVTECFVKCEMNGKIIAEITLVVKPYRYKVNMTVVEENVSGSSTIILSNLNMPVAPTVTVDSEMTLVYVIKGVEYTKTLSEGLHIIDTLILFQGNTEIVVTGTGRITFSYREGSK